ncbi:hypothetical protein ACJX0J_010612, partial [Zea mays]
EKHARPRIRVLHSLRSTEGTLKAWRCIICYLIMCLHIATNESMQSNIKGPLNGHVGWVQARNHVKQICVNAALITLGTRKENSLGGTQTGITRGHIKPKEGSYTSTYLTKSSTYQCLFTLSLPKKHSSKKLILLELFECVVLPWYALHTAIQVSNTKK